MQRSKTPPKGAAIFVATCLTREPSLISQYHGVDIAAELLGVETTAGLRHLAKGLAQR